PCPESETGRCRASLSFVVAVATRAHPRWEPVCFSYPLSIEHYARSNHALMGSAAVAQVRVEPVAGKETANGRRETGGTNSRTGCLSSRRVSGGDGERRARYRHTESAY